jgi:uncharacterized membrane protein
MAVADALAAAVIVTVALVAAVVVAIALASAVKVAGACFSCCRLLMALLVLMPLVWAVQLRHLHKHSGKRMEAV